MCGFPNMMRRARIGGRGIGIALCLLAAVGLAIGVVLWRGQDDIVVAIVVASNAEAPGKANRTPKPEEAAAPPELALVCTALDEDQHGAPTPACMDALDAHFLPLPVSRTILPVSPPLVWSGVFEGIGARIEAVDAALANETCNVPDGEIRPEIGERCAARAMAALDVLRRVCSMGGVWGSDHVSLSPEGFDLRALDLTFWDRVDRTFFRTNMDAAGRERTLERWAERSPDQEAWAAGKRRLDDLYYRTAWKRARCRVAAPLLYWMGGERWDGMLARAARLGDAFALAHHLGSAKHAAKLTELDPVQGFLQLASLDLRDVKDEWRKEDSEAGWSIAREQHQDRIRLLRLAGMDCGDCTLQTVSRAFHYTYDYHFRQCAKVQCANLEAMRELRAVLRRPFNDLVSTESARSLSHRKRAEAVALKYALAVEALARATGADVDLGRLRHLADADAPALLTAEEVEQARTEAAQLVAAAI